ncbi:MAG: lysoplasmalogenase [Dehalococcoidia bacterium]|nr:lysoplasmalogenase [Dehalococcoidia bacterium]
MTAVQKSLLYIFAAFAIIFIATLPFQPYAGNFVIKAIPAISLAVLALITVSRMTGKLLFVSLLLCAAGDVALELEAGKYFVIGLGLFLIAQIMFIATFSRDFKMQRSRIPIIVVLAIYALAIAFILTPSLREMAIPVYCYLVAITLMGIFAALRGAKNKFTLYGAVSFIVSDSIIAINKFMMPVPAADYLVMITYYLAIFLITFGYLKSVITRPAK